MTKSKVPAPPRGTGASGRALWRATLGVWEFDAHEVQLFRELVRVVDRLDKLNAIVGREGLILKGGSAGPRVHPAAVEARQLALVQARLTAALRLPDGEEGDETQGRRQRRVGVRGFYAIDGGAS